MNMHTEQFLRRLYGSPFGLNDWLERNEQARSDGAPKQALKPAKEAAYPRGWLAAGPSRITSRGTDFQPTEKSHGID